MDDTGEFKNYEGKVFVCQECGYSTIDEDEIKLKKCPECGGKLEPEKLEDKILGSGGFMEENQIE